jgi:hypothetical protein
MTIPQVIVRGEMGAFDPGHNGIGTFYATGFVHRFVVGNIAGGVLRFDQGVGVLRIANAYQSRLSIGAGPRTTLIGGDMQAFDVDSESAFNLVRFLDYGDGRDRPYWMGPPQDSGGNIADVTIPNEGSSFAAPSVGAIVVSRSFSAGLTLLDPMAPSSLGLLAAPLGIIDSTIRSAATISTILSRAIERDQIYVGLKAGFVGVPHASSDFASATARVTAVRVLPGGGYRNSIVVAPIVNAVLPGRVFTNNGGTTFGVFGGRVSIVVGVTDTAKVLRVIHPKETGDLFESGDFIVRQV